MGSILHLHTVPAVGGDTLFASMYAAYEALSPRMKSYLEGLTATHSGDHVYRRTSALAGTSTETGDRVFPKASHPIVRTHPVAEAQGALRERRIHHAHRRAGAEPKKAARSWTCCASSARGPASRCGSAGGPARSPSGTTACYSGGAPKEALNVLTPQFEQRTGHKVHYTYAVISEIQKKLAAGDTPDMVFMPVGAIDALVKAGTLRAQPRGVLGSVGIGVIVREGAPHPDIATPEAFKNALHERALGGARQSERDAAAASTSPRSRSNWASTRRSRTS